MNKNKIIEFKHLAEFSRKIRKKGQRIVFTTGSFELITPGHCRFLSEAKAQGDILIVGVCTDRSITKAKGPDFPLLNQNARMEMLSYLQSVDFITLIEGGEPHTAIVLLEPDVCYVNEKDLENGDFDEQARYLLKKYKGRMVVRKDDNPYKSARDLIEHIANIRFTEIVAGYLWSRQVDFDIKSVSGFVPADYGLQQPNNPKAFNPSFKILKSPQELERVKHSGKVVLVSGSFDLLHVGHARFINNASGLGNILVVGIPSDAMITSKKGHGRPIINQYSRAYVLASLRFVDYVYIFNEDTVLETLQSLKPEIFFTVDESWNNGLKKSREYKAVRNYRGRVVVEKRQSPFLSSSIMINRMALKKVREIFGECLQDEKFKAMMQEGVTIDAKESQSQS